MATLRILSPRKFSGLALVGILAMVGYGYAANNTVPASNAGDGMGEVSGFEVTDIHYTLNASTPQNLTSIEFTVAPVVPAGGAVRVSIDNGTTWLAAGACSVSGGTDVACSTSALVTAVQQLRVVAAQ